MAFPIQELPVELLEQVLWFLPNTELLLAQRVSHYWQTTISESPKLQIALFRSPQQNVESCVRSTYAYRPRRSAKEKRTWRVAKAISRDMQGPVRDEIGCFKSNTGRFIEERWPVGIANDSFFVTALSNGFWEGVYWDGDEHTELNFTSRMQQAIESDTTEWRSILVTQPPAKSVVYSFCFKVPPPAHSLLLPPLRARLRRRSQGGTLESEQGVTLGQIADQIRVLEREMHGKICWGSAHIRINDVKCLSSLAYKELEDQDDSSDDGADFDGQGLCDHGYGCSLQGEAPSSAISTSSMEWQ